MRKVALVSSLAALISLSLFAGNVEVQRPRLVYLPEASAGLACLQPLKRACTRMDTEFFCNCVQRDDDWALQPRFIVSPFIYTTSRAILRHEMEHIDDVRASLNEYAAMLLLRRFDSSESCASFIANEKRLFPSTMHEIQRLTAIRRDGVQVTHSGSDH
ncbi:MAG TPA: hypothetical protein VF980_14190 [Thermoanaerobaculia bacterium]